jgi:hypothetical protein
MFQREIMHPSSGLKVKLRKKRTSIRQKTDPMANTLRNSEPK